MKTKLLLLVLTIVFTTTKLRAADFTVDGIAYTITSATAPYTVAVALKSTGYTGAVTIPEAASYNSINYSVTSIGSSAFYNCTGLTSVTIPNSVTAIGDQAFQFCSGLTSITIGNSVTSIGDQAFGKCTGLISVAIPNSVTSIGYSAFSGCTGLTSVIIPNSVTTFGYFAFAWCSGLTSITISNSVTSISDQAFQGCAGLTSVTIPHSVTSIGNNAFNYCTSLTSVTIPNSVTSIGYGAFQYCSGLTSVIIPNSVTTIGKYTFSACTGLTSVSIPNSITAIGSGAFYDCTGFTSIYADNAAPVDLSSSTNVFYKVNKTACTLYVPIGSKSLYAAANQWMDFTNIVEHIVTGIVTVSATKLNIRVMGRTMEIGLPDASAPVQVVDSSGRQLYNGTPTGSTLSVTIPQAGIYLVRVGKKVVKVFVP